MSYAVFIGQANKHWNSNFTPFNTVKWKCTISPTRSIVYYWLLVTNMCNGLYLTNTPQFPLHSVQVRPTVCTLLCNNSNTG